MNSTEFLNSLDSVSHSYRWDVDKSKKVTATIRSGPHRGFTLNPVTALAHKKGYGLIDNTRQGTELAASFLGIPRSTARKIYSSVIGTYNRGNTQVFRGRIRSALEV